MRARSTLLPLLFSLACLSGCQVPKALTAPSEEEQREIERKRELPTEVSCFVLEYDGDSKERPRPRKEPFDRVEFAYTSSQELKASLAALQPTHVFVVSHGWMNNSVSSPQFASKWVHGIRARAQAGERLAFVSIHWDSEQVVFHTSAELALEIGRRRVSHLLEAVRQAVPETKLTVIGHSLGARLMLSALDASAARYAHAALLVEGAANASWLRADYAKACTRVGQIGNVYSIHDAVLEQAYANAMQSPAMGRVGAERSLEGPFVRYELGASFDAAGFAAAVASPDAAAEGGARVVNVDASGVVTGHTDIDHDQLYDLVWTLAR